LLPTEIYTESDKRSSAIQLGTLGIGLVAAVFVLIIVLDAPRLMDVFRLCRKSKRRATKSNKKSTGEQTGERASENPTMTVEDVITVQDSNG
jgi:hypothetical protein